MRRTLLVAALAAVALIAVACGDDDETTPTGGNGDGANTVDITLQEFAVLASPTSASAGDVTFSIANSGEETHEFVVIRTDLSALDLPTADDGSVSEEGEGMEVVDEVEDIPSGDSPELTVSLDAGAYVLICNIVEKEDGETESHYQEGMRTSFEVE
jgi:uncharacterized cupredoxin-like copper-binding protein